ncbi:MAG TPA: choice-of-anchor tandem repeat GloVer-containing protein, partial [Terriglobales bacterium]
PLGELTLDSAGNVYGTLTGHNTKGDGGVFKLSQKDGTWTETLLHNFNGSTGKSPTAGLVLDSSGNLYGAAYAGGTDNDGVVFELEP